LENNETHPLFLPLLLQNFHSYNFPDNNVISIGKNKTFVTFLTPARLIIKEFWRSRQIAVI
jgi:hypothetical protein